VAALVVWFLKSNIDLGFLPAEVAASYNAFQRSRGIGWKHRGPKDGGFYMKTLKKDTPEFLDALNLFTKSLHFDTRFSLDKVISVYNPTLLNNFVGHYRIICERASNHRSIDAHDFFSRPWEKDTDKSWVHKHYQQLCEKCCWNKKIETAIVPVFHGTDLLIAHAICETGFAALSSLDAGWYGKGIYFTSHLVYAIPYICTRKSPAMLVSWIIPGNVYPVTESASGSGSLVGQPMRPGFTSHFVLTDREGKSIRQPTGTHCYDEFVVPQENQICPAYILQFEQFSSLLPTLFSRDDSITIETSAEELF